MDGTPELTYFAGPGRGELSRLAFAAGGVEFKDTRLSMEDWPAVKMNPESTPAQLFGNMPVISHGDLKVGQSTACSQYAAELGINKKNNPAGHERAQDTMLLGAHADVQTAMYKCLFGSDDSKAAGKEALPAATAPTLAAIDRALGRNSGPFLYAKDGPSLGDLAVLDLVSSPFPGLVALGIDLAKYPNIGTCVAACKADATLGAYLAKRGF